MKQVIRNQSFDLVKNIFPLLVQLPKANTSIHALFNHSKKETDTVPVDRSIAALNDEILGKNDLFDDPKPSPVWSRTDRFHSRKFDIANGCGTALHN